MLGTFLSCFGQVIVSPTGMMDEIGMQAEGMSPNMQYAAGLNQLSSQPAIWTVGGGVKEYAYEGTVYPPLYDEYTWEIIGYDYDNPQPDPYIGMFHAINNAGIAVGEFGSYYSDKMPCYTNVNRDSVTYLYMESGIDVGGSAYAVNADGSFILGFYYDVTWIAQACIWKNGGLTEADRVDLPSPTEVEFGGPIDYVSARWMSEDASVILGYAQDAINGEWVMVYWTRNQDGSYTVHSNHAKQYFTAYTWDEGFGNMVWVNPNRPYARFEPHNISANGEWISLTVKPLYDLNDWNAVAYTQAARLNLTTNELEVLPRVESETAAPEFFDIANNGTAVGATAQAFGPMASARKAPNHKTTALADGARNGMVWFAGSNAAQTLQEIYPTVGYFSSNNAEYAISGINADATSIVGYSTQTDGSATSFITTIQRLWLLSVSANNADWGNVRGGGSYSYNSSTVISATPNTGYHFVQWSDGNTDNPRTVVVTSDTTFTAVFAKNQYAISTSVQSGNGTTYGDSIAEYQDQIQLSAVADYGWQFSRWSDGNGSNPRTVVATEDKEYKAIFVRKNFYVSVLSANTTMGYVNGSGNYEYESNATISATGRLGYEFNEWSDGNAENPRTFVVTGDTTFTATFRMQTQGECGNDLRWEYRNNVLYISGTGAMANYSTSTQPWYLYRDSIQTLVLNAGITSIGNYAFYGLSKITKLTLPEGLTTIGAYAFSGCNHITEIIFSSTISSIGEYAFYNCTRVLDMTNYATVTPDVATNALTSISSYAYLYVQAGYKRVYLIDNNWSRFDLHEIGAEAVTTPVEDVVVEPSENEAEFTWPTSTEAASYSLTITKDGIVFCTLTFNANGQLTGLAFAPDRNGAEHAAAATTSVAGMTFTVTGLDAATAYAFSFDAKNASQQVIESYTGTFETAGYKVPDTPTDLEHVDGVNKYVNTPTKLLRDGQVLIQRGEKMYDLRGQKVK